MSTAARIRAWATANGLDPASVTATCDGERIIEINGSHAFAAQAMALSQIDIDAAQAAQDRAALIASLPAALLPLAAAYRTTLRALFGDGAETNHAITEQAVMAFFLSKRANNEMTQQLDNAERILEIASREICKVTPDGTCWSFPWEIVP